MPIKLLSTYKALKAFLKVNTCFIIQNNKLWCNICNIEKCYIPREGITPLQKHLTCEAHRNAEKSKYLQTRLNVEVDSKDFHSELLLAFAESNIPIHKLESKSLKLFLERWTGKTIKDESFYRKTLLDEIYKKKFDYIKNEISKVNIYLIFDESKNSSGLSILNILAGKCSAEKRERAFLISSIHINKTNSETIILEILSALNKIYDNDASKYKNIKLLVSDGAPYAIKTGTLLKGLVPECKHITCLCHALHNLCETIRDKFSILNDFVVVFKKLLIKNKTNQYIFSSETGLPIPKFPIVTRWGTWLEFVSFTFDNFEMIKKFSEMLPDDLRDKIYMQNIIQSECFAEEMKLAYAHKFLIEAIKMLESDTLSTVKQISILKDVIAQVNNMNIFNERLNAILDRNPDLTFFINFDLLKANTIDKCYAFIPLTSASVERSFSNYNYIFSEKRRNLLPENTEKYLSLYFNS